MSKASKIASCHHINKQEVSKASCNLSSLYESLCSSIALGDHSAFMLKSTGYLLLKSMGFCNLAVENHLFHHKQ